MMFYNKLTRTFTSTYSRAQHQIGKNYDLSIKAKGIKSTNSFAH